MNEPRPGDPVRHAGDEHEAGRSAMEPTPSDDILVFSAAALREVDRLARDQYGLPTLLLMENAGRALAQAVLEMGGGAAGLRVLLLCGPGNNGGDGYTAARHLVNAGANVRVVVSHGMPRTQEAAEQFSILNKMRVGVIDGSTGAMEAADRAAADLGGVDVVVDCLLGTGITRAPEGAVRELIEWSNAAHKAGVAVVAADIPSGMDADTGGHGGSVVLADQTVSFAGLKSGFLDLDAQPMLGEVTVADIGVPRELLERLGERLGRPPHFDWPETSEPPAAPPASHPGTVDS